jgi:iron(III) transport system permease protein
LAIWRLDGGPRDAFVSRGSRRRRSPNGGALLLWTLIVVIVPAVIPPLFFLLKTSLSPTALGGELTLNHFSHVIRLGGLRVWTNTLVYSAASSSIAMVLGVGSAWLASRTNAYFGRAALVAAYLSIATPVMIKAIGWILLLGPNMGLINLALRASLHTTGPPIVLFSLAGMSGLEGVFWAPVVMVLSMPVMAQMNSALEEAAVMAGASALSRSLKVTLPLAAPGLLAVLFLTLMRSLESFEVPLLVGEPGGIHTLTTAIYDTIYRGFVPQYADASAFGVLLIFVMVGPLYLYSRVVRQRERYAVISGKAYKSSRIDLGRSRALCSAFLLTFPICLLAPVVALLWASLLPAYEVPQWSSLAKMSFGNYFAVLTESQTLAGVANGLVVAGLSGAFVSIFVLFAAWVVVRRPERAKWTLDALSSMPIVLPGIVLATAILIEFLGNGFIPIYETIWILVLAFFVQFLPYGIRIGYSSILKIDVQLEESAISSGAGLSTVLRRVVFPLALPSLAAVWAYVFLHSIKDLSVPVILAGPNTQMIANVILNLWNDGKIPQVGALCIALDVSVLIFGALFMRATVKYRD